MSNLRTLKRKLDSYRVAVAEKVTKSRNEKGYEHFRNKRSLNKEEFKVKE